MGLKVGGKKKEQSMFQSSMEYRGIMAVGCLKVGDIWKMVEKHMSVSARFISKMYRESLVGLNGDLEG